MALTTLDKARQWVNVSGNADDALLTRLIAAASGWIETYLSRAILSASYSESRDGNDHHRMPVANYPIISVTSVAVDGVTIPQATSPTSTGWIAEKAAISLRGYTFTAGVQNVQIAYTAGYATCPDDLEQVCLKLVGLQYKNRDRIGHTSKQIGGETVAFSTRDMDEDMRTIMLQYRRVVPV